MSEHYSGERRKRYVNFFKMCTKCARQMIWLGAKTYSRHPSRRRRHPPTISSRSLTRERKRAWRRSGGIVATTGADPAAAVHTAAKTAASAASGVVGFTGDHSTEFAPPRPIKTGARYPSQNHIAFAAPGLVSWRRDRGFRFPDPRRPRRQDLHSPCWNSSTPISIRSSPASRWRST